MITRGGHKFWELSWISIYHQFPKLIGILINSRISGYLIQSNVQLGATYEVGTKATAAYNEGYAAAAKYINASEEEIGKRCAPWISIPN